MKREIERRFLVAGEGWQDAQATLLCQAYLHAEAACTVRVRLANEEAWLTIKGHSGTNGMSRDEFEYAIPYEEARALCTLATAGRVEKWRRRVEVDGNTWEVDEFIGDNAGLVLAELELDDEKQAFSRPSWLGKEVTSDARYTNACLAQMPYSRW